MKKFLNKNSKAYIHWYLRNHRLMKQKRTLLPFLDSDEEVFYSVLDFKDKEGEEFILFDDEPLYLSYQFKVHQR